MQEFDEVPTTLLGNPRDEALWRKVVADSTKWCKGISRPGEPPRSPGPGIAPFDYEEVSNRMNYEVAGDGAQPGAEQFEIRNIVKTWRQVVTDQGRKKLKPALDAMNAALGTSIRHDRIAEWEKGRGGRKPSAAVYEYMLRTSLPFLLSTFSTDSPGRWAAALGLP